MENLKNLGGRPPKSPDEKLEQRSIRLKPCHWRKVDALGLEWLRALIERGKPPKRSEE